jgi:hypothetical protein
MSNNSGNIDVFASDDSLLFNFGRTIIPAAYKTLAATGNAVFASNLSGDWKSDLAQHRLGEPLTAFIEQIAALGCDTVEVHAEHVHFTVDPTAAIGPRALAALTANFKRHHQVHYIGRRYVHATAGFQGL